jgi:uncharacterized protein DUF4419
MTNIKASDIAHLFAVNDVKVGDAQETITKDQIVWNTKGKIEARGVESDTLIDLRGNRFLRAVKLAYDAHYPLVLSPDHVWLMIAQGFSHHVNENAEELRSKFVDHEGKEKIVLEVPPGKGDPFYHWVEATKVRDMEKGSILDQFVSELRDRVKGEIVDAIMPTFTTTTIHSHASMAVTTMSTFQAYFEYGMRTMCGIPEVTLLGEAEDWVRLAGHARQIAEGGYGTEFWMDHLLPVLDKMVESAGGNPDPKFWEQIIQVGGGSGGPYVSGWVNTLLPYMAAYKGKRGKNRYMDWEKGARMMSGNNPGDFEASVAVCPFEWDYLGTKYQMEFEAGIVGASQDPITMAIQPEIGWAVADVTNVAN